MDAAGNLFIADSGNSVIREIAAGSDETTTFAGDYALGPGYSGDSGPATSAQLDSPVGIAIDSALGILIIGDEGNGTVREVDISSGTITTVESGLDSPTGVAVDVAGDIFIAESGNIDVQVVDHVTGVMSDVAGSGAWGFGGDDGPAIDAQMEWPTGLAVNSAGNLFVADASVNSVREVTGLISTVVGDGNDGWAGNGGYSGDNGSAVNAQLWNPNGVALDAAGDIFIADTFNNVVREVNATTGVITTVAGDGSLGYSGDNGPAIDAELNDPQALLVRNGYLFIADSCNNVVREVNLSTGIITTLVGNGTAGYEVGPLSSTELNQPIGLAMDAAGNLFIADDSNNVVEEVTGLGGSDPQMSTIAGNYALGSGYSGDNEPATSAN